MAWFEEAIFYHIYPLGLTGAPKQNDYGKPVSRLAELQPWIEHVKEIGCNAIYIGPLFESVGHGYETTDYKKLDSRLGTNEDLKKFVADCHNKDIHVILDGVFNHTGRDFFAFKDLQKNRENSQYKDWYCNVNFYGNTEYNDGFSYENWGGYNLLVKLNQHNPQVREYIADVIRFWVEEFDVDGIRLDAADVLDFSFMKMLRAVANEVKEDFWLMGEVIHGDYNKWANDNTLHSVTNYQLHKALYSGHNDHNYFEIAHTVKRLYEMFSGSGVKLYNFVDNHDVERIYTKLQNKNHFTCVHIMLYTLPGIPSLYYGSEYGIEGRKERGSDDSLRPCLKIKEMPFENEKLLLISKLAKIRKQYPVLATGNFEELRLTNRQYVFARTEAENRIYIAVNNDENGCELSFPVRRDGNYVGLLSGKVYRAEGSTLRVSLPAVSGEIWVEEGLTRTVNDQESNLAEKASEKTTEEIRKREQEEKVRLEREAAEIRKREQEEKARSEREATEIRKREQEEKVRSEREAAEIRKREQEEKARLEREEKERRNRQPEKSEEWAVIDRSKSYEEMSIRELQAVIYEKMAKNDPVTDRMKQDILENVYHNSLVTWAKSF